MPHFLACLPTLAGRIFGSALLLVVAASALAESLFADPHFEQGFRLTGASHAQVEQEGIMAPFRPPRADPPAWRIAQWGTQHLLTPGSLQQGEDTVERAGNRAKSIDLLRGRSDAPVSVRLSLNGSMEFGERLRKFGEAWPHLLLDQQFSKPILLAEHPALPFSMSQRLLWCRVANTPENSLDPSLHTAQATAYWTVHAVRDGVVQGGEMIWFGIPLFDARYPIPPGQHALDVGQPDASGKFICVLDGARFWGPTAGPGEDPIWQDLAVDLRPLLAEALVISQEHGHLEDATLEDLALTSFNIGWEVTGPYDAAIEFRNLRFESGE